MHLCNHFFAKSTFLQTIFFSLFIYYLFYYFFFTVPLSLVLKLFELELFFEKIIDCKTVAFFALVIRMRAAFKKLLTGFYQSTFRSFKTN